jgi:hypothetical protein
MARLVFAFVIGLLLTQSANAQNTKPLTTEELASHTIYRRAVERQSQESDAEFASHHLWSPYQRNLTPTTGPCCTSSTPFFPNRPFSLKSTASAR